MKKNYLLLLPFLILLSCSPFKKYQEKAKFWEKEIQNLEKKDKIETDPQNAILFVGSSSIRLWNNIAKDMAPYPVIQRGYGGAKFSDLVFYTERLVYPHDFRALVIFMANDISGSKDDIEPQEVLKLVKKITKIVRKKYPNKPIYYIAVTPSPSRWKVWNKIKEFNQLLEDYCQKHENVYYIATQDGYLDANGYPKSNLYRADSLHQTQAGYDIWASIIKDKLNKTLK